MPFYKKMPFSNTGSFRKNGKSKTVFMGTKFHEKLIFSAFFSRELATNLRSWATRSQLPSGILGMWRLQCAFRPSRVGCLKPTADPETLSKDHKGVFWSVRGKIGSTKDMNVFIQLILIRTSQNTMGGLRSKDLRQWSTSIILPGPETTLEAPPSQDATG